MRPGSWAGPFALLALAGCIPITLSTEFEGGMLGRVERLGAAEFLCHLEGEADREGRNRQVTWYAFRIDHAAGREVTVTLDDLRGEYDYRPAAIAITEKSPPFASADGRSWRALEPMTFDPERARVTLRVTPTSDSYYISHLEPYTVTRLELFLAGVRTNPHLRDETIGRSVQGRALHLLTITGGPESPKPVIWLMCRQHAWESGTSFVGEGAIRYLLSEEAKSLRDRVVFKVFPMLDPDGAAQGGVRFNRNGFDVNRNWDTADPASAESRRLMPEICAAKKAMIDSGRVALFVTLHNQEADEWMSGSERHRELSERLFARLVERTTFNPGARGPRPPKIKPEAGRATVYEYFDLELGKPAFILEQGIAYSSRLGRVPTSKDRLEFGAQLARTLCEVVLER